MANPWFRLYHEFADDPKVQMMTEAMQPRLVMLMRLRCKDATLHDTQLAFYLRISAPELAETKQVFLENGFIDEDWNLLNWNKRQFISDYSNDRVRKHRQAKKQGETLHERHGNGGHTCDETKGNVTATANEPTVTVTAPDMQMQKQKQRRNRKNSWPKLRRRRSSWRRRWRQR